MNISTLLNTRKLLLSLLAIHVVIVSRIAAVAPGAAAQTVYRDAQENIYIENLKPDYFVTIAYSGAAPSRYQQAWMYKKTTETCPVHHLWRSKKFAFGDWSIMGTPAGNLTVNAVPYSSINTPCNGANRNTAITWKQVSPGVYVYQTQDSCRFNYVNSNTHAVGCVSSSVAYIYGLPGSAYLVKSFTVKQRMAKVTSCKFLKIPNTPDWQSYTGDRFSVTYDYNDDRYAFVGTYTRSLLPIKTFAQIPKCFDGKRFMYQP